MNAIVSGGRMLALLLLGNVALCTSCLAQSHSEPPYSDLPIKVFHLSNAASQNDANEVMVGLRNMLDPRDKVYLLPSTNDVAISGPPDQIAKAGQLIAELDQPRKAYRLTYTLIESDAGKRVGVQHFSMVVLTGQRIMLKQGDKIPIVTGSFDKGAAAAQTQVTYLDIGVNLDSTLDQFANGLRLRSRVEQSSVAEGQNGKLPDDPIVRQSVLEGTSVIVPGKPVVLGSLDIVGSTRHTDVEVVAEPIS